MPERPPSAAARVATTDRVAVALATVLGVGRSPLAPGTVASAVTAIVLAAVPWTRPALVASFVAVTAIGLWASHLAERALGEKDPGAIVIDEVSGMTLSVLLSPLPLHPASIALAFVLFRLFDVVKPFPAGRSQDLPGGAGVMVDDLIAGLYALAGVALVRRLAGWPA